MRQRTSDPSPGYLLRAKSSKGLKYFRFHTSQGYDRGKNYLSDFIDFDSI